jgi:UDP-glucose 4-epimerase
MDLSNLSVDDFTILEKQIQKANVVFHFAASVGVDNIDIVNSYMIDHNILNLFEMYKPKVIYSSSSEVYGDRKTPMKEDDILKIDPKKGGYPTQKLMTEQMLKALDIPHIIVRFFNIVGPGQNAEQGFVIPRFIESALLEEPLEVYQPESVRSFMDIRDALEVLENLIYLEGNDVINIGNPDNKYNMKKAAKKVRKVFKKRFNYKPEIKITNKRSNEIKNRIPDITKMKKLYTPKYSLEDTIKYILKEEYEF